MKKPTHKELRQIAKARLQTKTPKVTLPLVEDTQKLLHELQVHQIELEMQNDELREAKDAKDLALYRFTELFDFAPVAYFTLDKTSKITQVNLLGASLLELDRLRLIGRLFLHYMTQAYRVTLNDFLEKAFDTGSKQNCEILIHVGKRSLWLTLEASIDFTATECLVAMIDTTAHKQAV
jgi:PAS domain-containing protein